MLPAQRASDTAYEELRERILDLRLAPGTVVFEQALAADLGLGRMPVREALARRAAMCAMPHSMASLASNMSATSSRLGAVTVVPRRGCTVTNRSSAPILSTRESSGVVFMTDATSRSAWVWPNR